MCLFFTPKKRIEAVKTRNKRLNNNNMYGNVNNCVAKIVKRVLLYNKKYSYYCGKNVLTMYNFIM